MITDLAVMLLTAGLITILFKRIHQPLILGYILAGFLIGPYFPLFFYGRRYGFYRPLSEIGVIILMFHIGLEFNLHKLAELGGTAVISAIVKMAGVMVSGYGLRILMGFSSASSLFLGGMLSISSTAVIQKSFEELGIKNEKYAQLVMGTLVIEDIVGIFMMVVLSTISVSRNTDGIDLAVSLALMVCYLIVWLILGIYLLPTFLNKVINLMTGEMIIILSLGLCFGMVLIANALGFSSELGAFLAGSLLAGTIHVEKSGASDFRYQRYVCFNLLPFCRNDGKSENYRQLCPDDCHYHCNSCGRQTDFRKPGYLCFPVSLPRRSKKRIQSGAYRRNSPLLSPLLASA